MSPFCECGTFVSEQYVRVFAPRDVEGEADVRACPSCDKVRDRNEVRKARSHGGYDVEVEEV